MIKVLQDLPANVIGLEASGKVSREDYEDVVIPQIDEKQRRFDKVRMLYILGGNFEGYTAGGMWEDATLAFKRPSSWEKIAVVTDEEALRKAIAMFAWMVPGEVKVYPTAETGAARDWAAA